MVQTIDAVEERKLLDAVKQASELVDAGKSPDDAVEKVARDNDFGPGKIRLLGYAFNTGRQLRQWEDGGSILDKLAGFTLCDPQTVIDRIFSPKTAAVIDDNAYAPPPPFKQEEKQWAKDAMVKAAFDSTKSAAAPVSAEHRLTLAYAAVEKQVKTAAEASRTASYVEDLVRASVNNLVGYFKTARDKGLFKGAEEYARTYYGDGGKALMDLVYQQALLREKRASDTLDIVTMEKRVVEPGLRGLIDRCIKLASDAGTKRETAKTEAAKIASVRQEAFAPFVQAPANAGRGESVWSPEAASVFGEKRAYGFATEVAAIAAGDILAHKATHKKEDEDPYGDAENIEEGVKGIREEAERAMKKSGSLISGSAVGGLVGGTLGRTLGTGAKTKDELIEDAWMDLEDPAHDNELRKIQANTMLTSMLSDPDDPISGHEPSRVLDAYNELAQSMPRGATQPGLIRPLLRKKLEGHQEPFEAKEMLDIEKGLAATRSPTPNTNLLARGPDSLLG